LDDYLLADYYPKGDDYSFPDYYYCDLEEFLLEPEETCKSLNGMNFYFYCFYVVLFFFFNLIERLFGLLFPIF